jgi:hypothetical protein
MGRKKIPRVAGYSPQVGPRAEVTGVSQLMPYYGGEAQMRDLLAQAKNAQMRDRLDLDPGLAEVFPEINHDNYDATIPVVQEPGLNYYGGGYGNEGGIDPMIYANTRHGDREKFPGDMDALGPVDEGKFSWLAQNVERPLTEALLDDTLTLRDDVLAANAEDAGGQFDSFEPEERLMDAQQRDELRQIPFDEEPNYLIQEALGDYQYRLLPQDRTPESIDSTLAQLRRHGGNYGIGEFDGEELLNSSIKDAVSRGEGGEYLGSEAIPQSGITLGSLIAMAQLPENVRKFLPKRMEHLLGVGGVAAGTGLAAGGGMNSDRNRPTMNANYTMGPLSGLR